MCNTTPWLTPPCTFRRKLPRGRLRRTLDGAAEVVGVVLQLVLRGARAHARQPWRTRALHMVGRATHAPAPLPCTLQGAPANNMTLMQTPCTAPGYCGARRGQAVPCCARPDCGQWAGRGGGGGRVGGGAGGARRLVPVWVEPGDVARAQHHLRQRLVLAQRVQVLVLDARCAPRRGPR